jgi:hypothetical protein
MSEKGLFQHNRRNADIRQIARVGYGGNSRRRTGLIAAIAHGVVSVFEGQADEVPQIALRDMPTDPAYVCLSG